MFRDFRRILKPDNKLYEQERGLITTREELLNLFEDTNIWPTHFYENYTSKLMTAIDFFLEEHAEYHDENPLRKDVILEIIFLYIKYYPTYLEYETELRREDRDSIQAPAFPRDNVSHIDGANHYMQELYCYLVHGPNFDKEKISNSMPKLPPKLAREALAHWLMPLDQKKDEDEQGKTKLLFMDKIQKASKRWNIYQAPNKRRGVYLSGTEIVDGVRTWKVLYDEDIIQKYCPNYNPKKS